MNKFCERYFYVSGSYTLSQLILDASAFTVSKSYQYSFIFAECVSDTCCVLYHWSRVTFLTTSHIVCVTSVYMYATTCWLLNTLYDSTTSMFETAVVWTLEAVMFLRYWLYTIVTVGSRSLYVGLNQYALHYGYVLVTHILDWIIIAASILIKFLTYLAVYFWRCISVATNQIYTIFYIAFGFCYHIVAAIFSIVRFWIDGMVFLVTVVFSGVIFVLERTIFAYTSAMASYNRYREILFLGACALIVVYCGGVVKDRRTSGAGDYLDGVESDTDEEEEEFIRQTISIINTDNRKVGRTILLC